MMRAAILLLLVGCESWPAFEPDDRPWPLDERQGTEVFRTDHGLRIASAYQADGLQIVFEEINQGWQLRHVDPDSLEVTTLPAPPLPPGARVSFGRVSAPLRAAIVTVADEGGAPRLHVLDEAWETLPALPLTGTPDQLGPVLAHDGIIYVGFAGRVFRWDGAWTEPVTAAGPIALGGFDAVTQWLLVGDGAGFAAVPLAGDGQVGASIAGPPGVAQPLGSSINGDGAGFQVLGGGALWWFDGATFAAGEVTDADGMASAPGSDRVVVTLGSDAAARHTFADAGALAGEALAPFTPEIPCGCDVAEDPTCACIPHVVGYVDLKVAPAADRIAITMGDDVDGYDVLSARFLDLPFAGDPFSP